MFANQVMRLSSANPDGSPMFPAPQVLTWARFGLTGCWFLVGMRDLEYAND